MRKAFRITSFGILIWLVNFIVGSLLYAPTGQPRIEPEIIFNIFVLITGIIGLGLMVVCFRECNKNHLREGIIIGAAWQIINSAMDIIILAPIINMPLDRWWWNIGLGHFIFPVMGIAIGAATQHAANSK